MRVCEHYHWPPPYIPADDDFVALCRLLLVAHHMGHVQNLAQATVSNYMSSAKNHYLLVSSLFTHISPVWGPKGKNHPLLSMLIRSIPYRHRPQKMILTPAWLHDGFVRCWSQQEYVAIVFMRDWMLRSGEACDTDWNGHLLMWSMVTFSVNTSSDIWVPLPLSDLRTTPCDMVTVRPDSRKFQDEPRDMPGRINFTHLQDPTLGVTTWCNLCTASLLQGWAITNHIDMMSPSELANRPILAAPHSSYVITARHVAAALRRLAVLRHEDPATVVPHCLRKSGINQLGNSSAITYPDTYLRAVGHKSIAASAAYTHPTPSMAQLVTSSLHTPSPALSTSPPL